LGVLGFVALTSAILASVTKTAGNEKGYLMAYRLAVVALLLTILYFVLSK